MAKAMQFDVGMDNGEFMRGSKDIARAISSLKSTVAAAGKSMNSSASGYGQAMRQSIRASREFEQSVENIKSRMDELRTSTASIKASADSFNTFKKSIENAEAEMGKLLEQQKQLIDMGAGGPSDAWNQNQAEIAKVTAELEKQQQAYYDYAAAVEYAEKRLSTGKDEWGHQLSDEEKKTYDEEANYNVELANQAVERIEAAEAALESLKQTQAELAANGENGPTQEFIDLTEEISNAESRLVDMKSILENMRSAGYENADRSDVYQDQISELQDLENELDNARAKKEEALKPPYMQSWEQMITVSGMISEGFGRIQNAAAGALYAIQHPVQAVDRALGTLIVKATQAAATFARMAGNAALSFLRRLASEAQNAAIQLAKLASNAVHGAFQKLAQGASAAGRGLLGLVKNNKAADGSFKRGFMTVMKYAFGVRSMYFLFRRLRTAVKEAFTEMAKSSPEVGAAIRNLQTALNGLKGSLATAFAPIFTAVAPALTYLINMLTAAMNALGAFFAALTGQNSYKKAVGVAKAAGGSASKSAKKAKKDVKDLKRELMGFDELNVLNGDKDNGSGGGGGGGAGSGMKFVDEQIPGGIKDFVDKLKELWNNKEFVKIGKLIADGINQAIAKAKELITWENVSAKIQEFVDAVAGIIEGLLIYVDWKNIGDTIAEGLRTVANTIDTFMQKVGLFMLAGTALAALVNGFFSNKKLWTDIGKTITDSVHSFLAFGQAFLDGFDETEAANGIRAAILKVKEDLPSIAEEFWKLVNTAFNKAGSFVNALLGGGEEQPDLSKYVRPKPVTANPKITVDNSIWDDLAENLSTGFNTVIENLTKAIEAQPVGDTVAALAGWITKLKNGINWEAVGNIIGASFQKALEGIGTAIAAFAENAQKNGEDLGKAINAAIRKVKWTGEGEDTVQGLITNLFKGAIGLVKGLFGKFDTAEFVKSLKGALEGVPWGDIAKDIWDFITEELAKLGNILTILFGGNDEPDLSKYTRKRPAGMEKQESSGVANLAQAIGKAVSEALTKLDEWIGKIPWDEWGAKVNEFLTNLPWAEWGSKLAQALFDLFGNLKEFFGNLVFGKEGYEDVKAYRSGDYQGQHKKVESGNVSQEWYDQYVQLAKQVENYMMNGSWTFNVGSALSFTGWDEFTQETQYAYFAALRNAFSGKEIYDYLTNTGKDATKVLAEGIQRGEIDVSEDGEDVVLTFADGTKTQLGKSSEELQGLFQQLGVDSVAGLTTAFGSEQENANTAITDTMNGVVETANEAVETGSPSKVFEELGNNIVAGLILGLGNLPDQLQTIWESLPEWAQTMFTSLGKTLGVNINANANGNGGNSGDGASSKDTKKVTKATKKGTKETQKNTKELKKNTAKRGEVDVNYEGAGFDTSGDKPKLNVGVNFVPGDGTEASEENTNGGLLGWLQSLFDADTIEAKVELIRQGWENFKTFMSQYGVDIDNDTEIGVLLDMIAQNWTSIRSFLGIPENSILDIIIQALLNNWKGILAFLGIPENATIGTIIKLALEKFNSLLDFLGIDKNNPISVLLNLLFGDDSDKEAKEILGTDDKTIQAFIELVKNGWNAITAWLGIDKPLSALIGLLKNNWQTIAKFLGIDNPLTALVGLVKNGWNGIKAWLGIDDPLSALVGLAKDGWTTIAAFVGTAVSVFTALKKDGWTDIASFVGTAVSIIANLTSTGSNWVKDGLTKWFGGGKNPAASIVGDLTSENSNWKTAGGIGAWFNGLFKTGHASVSSALNLTNDNSNWKTAGGIGAWFNSLFKSGYASVSVVSDLTSEGSNWKNKGGVTKWFGNGKNPVASFIANLTTKSANWKKKGSAANWILSKTTSAVGFVANLTQKQGKEKSNFYKIGAAKWILNSTDKAVNFVANLTQEQGKEKSNFYGIGAAKWILNQTDKAVSFVANLTAGDWSNKTHGALEWLGLWGLETTVKVFIEQAGNVWQKIKDFLKGVGININTGGVIANGNFSPFASGGVIRGGVARYLDNVPHYASGTTRAHGTVFVAGEAGPEIMGHINGRTEILNKSQIAEAIYAAVMHGMGAAVNALGKYIANHMTSCTNSIVQTIAANAVPLSGVDYYQPAMANGGIMPYDVAMQIARSTQELQNTLDANNEDLIQAMVSAVGNAAQSIVQAMMQQAARGNTNRVVNTRTVVDDINRAGQMFGQSPIKGV